MKYYHYVLTLQWSQNGATVTRTTCGITTFQPGTTRAEAFAQLIEQVRVESNGGMGANYSCMFFSLEPNVLDGTA